LINLNDVSVYNDAILVGTVMTTNTATDSDPEDIADLTMTIQSATNSGTSYFEIVPGSRMLLLNPKYKKNEFQSCPIKAIETFWERFDYTSRVIRSRRSKKDRQYNGQKKRTNGQAMIYKVLHEN
jgi:hypothetical protein